MSGEENKTAGLRRRKLRKAPIRRTVTRGLFFGWWVRTYIDANGWRAKNDDWITEIWFLRRRAAHKYVAEAGESREKI